MSNRGIFDVIDFKCLDKYLRDKDITDINCRNQSEVWVTSNTKGHYRLNIKITSEDINTIVNQVANRMEKEFNPSFPCLEGDIEGKDVDLRVSAIHQHLSNSGTSLALRKVSKKNILTSEYLIGSGYTTIELLEFLIKVIKVRANIIIVGETGSGKTELLKFLATYIPNDQIIVTIEDSLEFNIKQINPKASCTSFRVKKEFDYSSIISMSLRQNVNWLLLQEARGKEVDDLLNAMSTGHSVMTTMHAKGSEGIGIRVKQMLHDTNESIESINMRIYSLVDLVIYLQRDQDGGINRYISSVFEYEYNYKTGECKNRVLFERGAPLKRCSANLKKRIGKIT